MNSWTILHLFKSPNNSKTTTRDRQIYIAFVIKWYATLFIKWLQPPSVFTYLVVEPATFLQGCQISLCDSQFESGAEDKVWITLSQRMTNSCCHFLQKQFTQGLTNCLISPLVQHSNYGLKCCSHLGKLRHLFPTVSWGCGVHRFSSSWIKRRNFSICQSEACGYLSRQVHFSQLFLLEHNNTSFYHDWNISTLHLSGNCNANEGPHQRRPLKTYTEKKKIIITESTFGKLAQDAFSKAPQKVLFRGKLPRLEMKCRHLSKVAKTHKSPIYNAPTFPCLFVHFSM